MKDTFLVSAGQPTAHGYKILYLPEGF